MRLRTTFYSTLCKLLFSDETNLRFKTFMAPFTQLFQQLGALSDQEFAAPAVRDLARAPLSSRDIP